MDLIRNIKSENGSIGMKNKFVLLFIATMLLTLSAGIVSATITVEKVRQLTNGQYYEMDPSWSPDGNNIAYSNQSSMKWNDDQIWVINADGSDNRQLSYYRDWHPVWSPDGTEIAFSRDIPFVPSIAIYKMNTDGSNVHEIAKQADSYGNLGPNDWYPSSKILYMQGAWYSQNYYIGVMEADGSNRIQLTFDGKSQYPVWSPDTSKIIYSSSAGDIWIMDNDGNNQKPIKVTQSYDSYPTVSPDGEYLAFHSDEGGNGNNIWVMKMDGSERTQLTTDGGSAYPNWSPDGKKIAFQSGNYPTPGTVHIWVMELNFDDEGPITSNLIANLNPVSVDTSITLTASTSDETTGGSTISSAEYNIDDGSFVDMSTQDGAFDEVTENITVDIGSFAEAGVHEICVRSTDSAGNVGNPECILVAVYNPSAGFVTGGGWIESQEGAYKSDPSIIGKANFGFVSKYKKGATIPTGQTEFQLRAGDLNFHSSSYDWLVIAGPKAIYKGTGTINGVGSYGFMLKAIDDELTPSTDVDMFRIKIWDKDDGDAVVYDNQIGDADDADLTTTIGGDSIKIHKG